MSYILDALKRADAERERGAVPGLHARQITTTAPRSAAQAQSRLWLILAALLALGGVGAGLWLWRAPAAETRLANLEPALAKTVVTAPMAQSVAAPASKATSATATAPEAPPLPSAATQAPLKTRPGPVAKVIKPKASAPAAPAPAPVVKASATPVAAPALPLLSELPEDIRRQVPALTITGAVYSETPAQRLLLVNNQVLTQGSLVAPDLTLEEIRARSSVFSFRGTRFRLAH